MSVFVTSPVISKQALVVQKTRIGKGILTMRRFAAGEPLLTVTGRLVTGDSDDDMDRVTRNNMFRYDSDRYVSPVMCMSNFLNHSCAPNAKVEKRNRKLVIVALTHIPKGNEVCIDYSTITAADDVWTMRCRCGSVSCRKVVRAFHTLPENTRAHYVRAGVVPRYILLLNRALNKTG